MPRLIDAIALYKDFREEMKRHPIPKEPGLVRYRAVVWLEAAGCFITMLSKAPTIEAEPVRHGRWEDTMCSNCLKVALLEELVGDVGRIAVYAYSNYCPNCGAKMDGEQ